MSDSDALNKVVNNMIREQSLKVNSLYQDLAVIKTKDTALDIKLSKLLHLLTNLPKESIFLK